MHIRSLPQGEVFGVLDIETRPDPLALTLMRQRDGARAPAALHQLTAASLLVASMDADGAWSDMQLVSLCEPEAGERRMLIEIDEILAELFRDGGTCVTFNGMSHDLPTLRRRAARHHLFHLEGINPNRPIQHIDLMRRCTRGWRDDWPSLKAACAGLGIPVNHMLADPRSPGVPATQRKCETDVVCTFLLLLHELAIAYRDHAVLERGWKALAELLNPRSHPAHLAQFAHAIPTFARP